LNLIDKCQRYGISYDLMKRLNYTDLLAMVVERDIKVLEDHLRQRERDRQAANGVEVVEATNEDILREHGQ